jgi:hypothetical protein
MFALYSPWRFALAGHTGSGVGSVCEPEQVGHACLGARPKALDFISKRIYILMVISIYRKILIAFDRDLLKRVDREARLQKLDRSKFVRKALAAYIVSEEFRRAEGPTDVED